MSTDKSQDAATMAALCQGDDGALDLLIARWQKPVLSYVHRYFRDEATARDVVEETFVRLYQFRDRFRPDANFSAWIFTIAANLCRNHLRWKRRHPESPLPGTELVHEDGSKSSEPDFLAAPDSDPLGDLARKEFEHALAEALDELTHDQRTAFLLFEYEDLSYEEIAVVLGCSTRSVETQLVRARQKLRAAMAPWRANLLTR